MNLILLVWHCPKFVFRPPNWWNYCKNVFFWTNLKEEVVSPVGPEDAEVRVVEVTSVGAGKTNGYPVWGTKYLQNSFVTLKTSTEICHFIDTTIFIILLLRGAQLKSHCGPKKTFYGQGPKIIIFTHIKNVFMKKSKLNKQFLGGIAGQI
jgi:hypothetical protein